jgi:hypothetical protein
VTGGSIAGAPRSMSGVGSATGAGAISSGVGINTL